MTVRCHSPGTRDGDDVGTARADPGESQLPRRDPLLLSDRIVFEEDVLNAPETTCSEHGEVRRATSKSSSMSVDAFQEFGGGSYLIW